MPQTSPRVRTSAMSVPPGHGNRQYVDDAQVREKAATSDAFETRPRMNSTIASGTVPRRSELETRCARERAQSWAFARRMNHASITWTQAWLERTAHGARTAAIVFEAVRGD